ncbi:MAG: hypothetical protein KBG15_20520 [Kofleriaceae bacterium]|nr:hypothetical protein [Kofleriaceae bacterium]
MVASASFGACLVVAKNPTPTPAPTSTIDDGANSGSGSNAATATPVVRPSVTNPPMPGTTTTTTAPPPVVAPTPTPVLPPVPTPSTRPLADRDYSWSVYKRPDGNCSASIDVKCPTGKPGMPVPTCNPPPPMTITCPTEMAVAQTVTIMQYKGTNTCVIPAPAVTCPPKTMCNPPAPTAVSCPK